MPAPVRTGAMFNPKLVQHHQHRHAAERDGHDLVDHRPERLARAWRARARRATVPRLSSCSNRRDEQRGDADQRIADHDGREQRQPEIERPVRDAGSGARRFAASSRPAPARERPGRRRSAGTRWRSTSRNGPRTSGLVDRSVSPTAPRIAAAVNRRASRAPEPGERERRDQRRERRSASPPGRRTAVSTSATRYLGAIAMLRLSLQPVSLDTRRSESAPLAVTAPRTNAGCACCTGRRSVARTPRWSVRFSSCRLPPWASAICRLRTRPMPEPPGLVVKNGTNRLPVFASPGPSSSTHSSTVAGDEPGDPLPADPHRPPPVSRDRVDGVANQVDQQLLELIGVALDRQRRARRRP